MHVVMLFVFFSSQKSTESGFLGLTSFDLFIFDECHHCVKDNPYNKIMRQYIDLKRKNPDKNFPQVNCSCEVRPKRFPVKFGSVFYDVWCRNHPLRKTDIVPGNYIQLPNQACHSKVVKHPAFISSFLQLH